MSNAGEIKSYWDERASNASLATETVTLPDHNQRQLEIETICRFLSPADRLLDIGCGNGYATALCAPLVREILAIDYSEAMIHRARAENPDLQNVSFRLGDVLSLEFPDGHFDAALTQRCLINLPSWEDQQAAIGSIHRVLRSGGRFVMVEGTRQGRAALNRAREAAGLPAMLPVAYNLDFDEQLLWPFVEDLFETEAVLRLGLYDLISRIVHPLFVAPDEPRYDGELNRVAARIAARLSGMDEISRAFIAVLRKK